MQGPESTVPRYIWAREKQFPQDAHGRLADFRYHRPMITALSLILAFQLVGEILSRSLDLPLPGPVVGLCLLVTACILRPALADRLRSTAQGLLAHLSLFFVPAGVGIVAHWPVLRDHGIGLALAIMGSTVLAIAAGALAFQVVARWTGSVDPSALKGSTDD